MRIQNQILCAIAAITLATVASAQQVEVISDADEAAAAGFSQPYLQRNHPAKTEGDERADSAGGVKSLEVTLIDNGYPNLTGCNDTNTPVCGGFSGIAYEQDGVTDSLGDIAQMGTVSFEFFDDSNLSAGSAVGGSVTLKFGCYNSRGMNAITYHPGITRSNSDSWEVIEIDMGNAQFQKFGSGAFGPEPLSQISPEDFCPSQRGGDWEYQIFVQIGDHRYTPDNPESYYFDRFKMGDASPVYDFDIEEEVDLPEAPEPPAVTTPVPALPPLGIALLAALTIWRARRSLA